MPVFDTTKQNDQIFSKSNSYINNDNFKSNL